MSKKSEPKAYKKDEFVSLVADSSGLNKTDSAKALDAVLASLEKVLANGDSVNFVGYGSFSIGHRAARDGRNPQTGEKIKIKASKTVKFSAGKKLKDAVQ
ncbi:MULTISPECIES: HU family DNA-binding protein [Cysteiniphilum]|uniref:HU family DNA-binding protein n=1 Tax=Cysteiniphilum TaxID=2056696 RepID=UPI00177CD94B|nr:MULTISPECIES: HU family DNA-binding protein [Cysteiniphilum]